MHNSIGPDWNITNQVSSKISKHRGTDHNAYCLVACAPRRLRTAELRQHAIPIDDDMHMCAMIISGFRYPSWSKD